MHASLFTPFVKFSNVISNRWTGGEKKETTERRGHLKNQGPRTIIFNSAPSNVLEWKEKNLGNGARNKKGWVNNEATDSF